MEMLVYNIHPLIRMFIFNEICHNLHLKTTYIQRPLTLIFSIFINKWRLTLIKECGKQSFGLSLEKYSFKSVGAC